MPRIAAPKQMPRIASSSGITGGSSSSSGMTGGLASSTAASSSGATGDTEEEIAAAHAEWTSDDERDFQGTFEQLIVELRNAFDRVEQELQAKR